MTPDNSIILGAGVALLGIVGLWMIRTVMKLVGEVRELRLGMCDPRTGILAILDKALSRIDRMEHRYDARFGVDG